MKKISLKQIDTILPLDFSKHAVRDISLLSCSIFGKTYISLKEMFNVKFTITLWIIKDNQATFYRSQKEQDDFAKETGERYKKDEKYAIDSANNLIKLTNWFNDFLKENIKLEDFILNSREFFEKYVEFFAYHQAVYWGGDHLTKIKADGDGKSTIDRIVKAVDYAYKYNELVVPNLEKYFKVLGIDNLLYDEIKDDDKNIIKINNNERSLLFIKNKRYVLSDNEALEIEKNIEELLLKSIKNIKEITGLGVSKGSFTGKVKKITELAKLADIKKNDVLVTTMTRPQYNEFINAAGAIITDEGGMLSHASILAREFNIPCIVGTKIATQVLKDGDLVEVDADKGVVRILEKAK